MTPLKHTLIAVAATAAVVPGAVAGAQDPGPPPNPDAAPLSATLSFPASVSKKALKKGVTATVSCDRACNARLSFAGPTGIVTQKSGAVTAGAKKKFKIKAVAALLGPMKKGSTYTLSLQARSDDGAPAQVTKKVRIR